MGGRPFFAEIKPGPTLLSSAGALEVSRRLRRIAEDVDDELVDLFWDRSWVPITENISGGVLACMTSGAFEAPCPLH